MSRRAWRVGGLGLLAVLAAACGEAPDPAPAGGAAPSAAEISAYLQTEAERLYPDVQGVRVTDLKLSEDRTVSCGLLRAPGRPAALFASYDTSPDTLERSMEAPYLRADTPREREIEANRVRRTETVCARNGLMPD